MLLGAHTRTHKDRVNAAIAKHSTSPFSMVTSSPPSLPPNDLLPRRFKVIWRVLLISNFALSAYMFASARKKDLGQMENDQAEKDLGQLENDLVGKHSDSEITEIPSTFMEDTTSIVTENISEDQQQEPFHSIVHGWREKIGLSKK